MAEPYVIKMPQLSDTMTEGTLVSWEKQPGERVTRGTIVATVETDKAIMDVEVFREGYLAGPLAAVGSVVAVGAPLGMLVATAEAAHEAATVSRPAEAPAAPPSASAPEWALPSGAQPIKMPQLSDTMSEGTLVSWERALGDAITRGSIVATVETDKAIMDVEVFREGFLSGPLVAPGTVVPVGEPLAYLVADLAQVVREGRTVIPAVQAPSETRPVVSAAAPKSVVSAMPHGATPAVRPRAGQATPYARQLAGAHGTDLNSIRGSGPGGVVVGADVLAAGAGTPLARRVFDVPGVGRPMDSMEKAVSHNMEFSLSMPLFRVTVHVQTAQLSERAKRAGVSLTVALAKGAALAIERHPLVNAVYQHEDRIVERAQIDIGIAVETEGSGLVVPVLRNVLPRSLADLSADWKDLVGRARARRLKPPEYAHPSFTISNMGMLGVASFDAIPVPGTSAILAIAAHGPEGMPLTLTADHRIVNGADAARFLKTLRGLLEEPVWLEGDRAPAVARSGAPAILFGKSAYDCDVAVIGGGPGGEDCARELAAQGKKVVLINDAPFPGGECLWRGCIPSKAWRAAADRIRDRQHDAHLGVSHTSGAILNWGRLEKTRRAVLETRGTMALKTDKAVKIDVRPAFARFVSDHVLELQALPRGQDPYVRTALGKRKFDQKLSFAAAVIATGAPPFVPPIPGIDSPGVLTSDTIWDLKRPPKRLAIIGAGAIGLEMAQIFADFGTKVLVLEAKDRPLAEVEAEVARTLGALLLKEKNLTLVTSAEIKAVSGKPGAMQVRYGQSGKAAAFRCDFVLVATGKRPVVEPLALDRAGVTVERGAVRIDAQCRTNVPHILAVGDVTGGLMLAHTAGHQGRVAAATLLGHAARYDRARDSGVIFTRPQAAFVGLSSEQAKAEGLDTVEIKTPMSMDAKAMMVNETDGFIKLVADKATRRIVGVHFLADHADTLIGEAVLMVSAGLTLDQVGEAIHPHPTQTEMFGDMARRLLARLQRLQRVAKA